MGYAANSNVDIKHKFKFSVDVTKEKVSETVAHFSKITGIEDETEVLDWRVGDAGSTKRFPGFTKVNPVTMERGIDIESYMYDWRQKVHTASSGDGDVNYKRDITIYVPNRDASKFRKILYSDAWPSKYSLSDLEADSTDAWVESLEIQADDMEFLDISK